MNVAPSENPETDGPSGTKLEDIRLSNGVFTANLRAPDDWDGYVELRSEDQVFGAAVLEKIAPTIFTLRAELPVVALNDGATALRFHEMPRGGLLATYPLTAGLDEAEGLATDLARLKAEFVALKQAFLSDAVDEKIKLRERPLIIAEAVEQAFLQVSAQDQNRRQTKRTDR